MVSAQQNIDARGIAFTPTSTPTPPTPTPQLMLLVLVLLLLLLLHDRRRHSTDREATTIMICFNGRPVIFNTHSILLTKSISSISNLKLNNNKKSNITVRKRKTKTMMIKMMMMTQHQQQWRHPQQ